MHNLHGVVHNLHGALHCLRSPLQRVYGLVQRLAVPSHHRHSPLQAAEGECSAAPPRSQPAGSSALLISLLAPTLSSFRFRLTSLL